MESGIKEMNRGSEKGKFFAYRKGGLEYLHSDGKWKFGASDHDAKTTAYFASRAELEVLLAQNPA